MAQKPTELSGEQLVQLADIHIQHYEGLITKFVDGDGTIRPDECVTYLNIWLGIKDQAGKDLTAPQLGEVYDAFYCGDYDAITGYEFEPEETP